MPEKRIKPITGGYFTRQITVPVGSPTVLYGLPFKGAQGLLGQVEIQREEPPLEYDLDPRKPAHQFPSSGLWKKGNS